MLERWNIEKILRKYLPGETRELESQEVNIIEGGKDSQGAPVSDAQPTLRIPAIVVGGEV